VVLVSARSAAHALDRRERAAARPTPTVRVLYIGGQGRSGTTLLDRMIGQVPGYFSVGEVVHLWAHGLAGERCGCGRAFQDCPVWSDIGRKAFGGWDSIDAKALVSLQRSVDRSRYVPGMLTPAWPAYQRRLSEYQGFLEQLYTAISEVADGRVVVDSSKHPSVAFLLRRMPSIDLRVVLMVRSSHGVAYSWTKVVEKPEVVDRVVHMPRYRPVRSAVWWTCYNGMFQALAALGTPTVVVQYEKLVSEPEAQVRRVLGLYEDDTRPLDFFRGADEVELRPTHTVSGNRIRFHNGPLQLHLDEEWRQRMSSRDRLVVSLAAAPLLHHFGYDLHGEVR
jgi:hypothetical protein